MGVGKISLLSAIWGQRQGFVSLPYKQPGLPKGEGWHEVKLQPWDGEHLPEIKDLPVDRYFCPVVFSKPHRRKEFALPTNILWADLDPVNPADCRLKPSIAWESSPGHYQALWFLSTEVPPEEAAAMSKRIAYADGGDHSGWDLTQVLRIPGTRNYKYESAPEGRLLWAKRSAYSVSEILAAYPSVNGDVEHPGEVVDGWPVVPEATIQAAIQNLPLGIKRRITRDTTGADRSKEFQMLSRDLIKAGVLLEVAAHIMQRSSWNKYAGRPSEHKDILRHINQAAEVIEQRKKPKQEVEVSVEVTLAEQMKSYTWGQFLQVPTHLRWLIDDAWVDQSVGFISGRSKSYKTWIALDLALSIVSGAAFLGRYPVRRSGPVLLIQEEDPSPVLQDRLRLIGKAKEMLPNYSYDREKEILNIEYTDYPLHIINLQGFNLQIEDKVAQVRRMIAEINPVMVILDPLIVMLGNVDENRATEVATLLQVVKMWREEFGCSILIVHHWNKGGLEEGERFAQHMYGSFAFHAWLESALHVMPVIEEERERIDTVVVEKEFKAAPSGRSLRLTFEIDTAEEYTYKVRFQDEKALTAMEQQLVDIIGESEQTGLSTPELVQMTGHARARVSEHLNRLVRMKIVVVKQGGGRGKSSRYWLPDNVPEQPK